MSKFIMGIDGGGTKGHLALFTLNGELAATHAWGTLNHEILEGAFVQLEDELKRFIIGALDKVGAAADDIAHTVIGLAGVDTQNQHEIITEIFRRIGLRDFTLCNDGYLGVPAGCPGGAGICAINGTGSVLTAIDNDGAMAQLGGIGVISDDCGGSGWYGSQALSAVYRELFKYGNETTLRAILFEKLGVKHRNDYVDAVTSALEKETLDIEELGRLVFTEAGAGDAVSVGILDKSAEHYASCIAWFAKELNFADDKPLYVTLAGSGFVKEKVKILPNQIEKRVNDMLNGRQTEFNRLDTPPVTGAVLWAFKNAKIDIDAADIKKAIALAGL